MVFFMKYWQWVLFVAFNWVLYFLLELALLGKLIQRGSGKGVSKV
jgi:hypothetical protein